MSSPILIAPVGISLSDAYDVESGPRRLCLGIIQLQPVASQP